MTMDARPRVAVIIPCFNQGRYLGEAIRSALEQTLPPYEVIVVDDGSTDETRGVAESFAEVRCVAQENRGAASARNTGFAASTAELIVFLDADDRLLPAALEAGTRAIAANPDAAFVFGRYRYVVTDGSIRNPPAARDLTHPYAAFLQQNLVVMHATVMYRRAAIERCGGFDPELLSCEDYDLYLRLAREWPVAQHDDVVAEYRRHDANKSSDPERILKYATMALDKQRPFVGSDVALRRAYAHGRRSWQLWFVNQLAARMRRESWSAALRDAWRALRRTPAAVLPFITGAAMRRLRHRGPSEDA